MTAIAQITTARLEKSLLGLEARGLIERTNERWSIRQRRQPAGWRVTEKGRAEL